MSSPSWQDRWELLLQALVPVQHRRGEAQLLEWLAHPPGPTVVAFANAHAFNTAAEDEGFFRSLLSVDLLLRDGIGVAVLMRLLHQSPGQNLNGTDLIPRIIRRHAGARMALFGTAEPWLGQARTAIAQRLAPGSRFLTADGFLPVEAYVEMAQDFRPRLILLGMGMPRQEAVAQALRRAMGEPCLIICGGAMLDFLGGRVVRAPRLLRAFGLEWAWRLAREPRRLFRRYVVGNPRFLGRAFSLATRPQREPAGGSTEEV